MALNLVKTELAPQACALIEALELITSDVCEMSSSLYGPERLLCWYFDNNEVGHQMRIVFDPEGSCKSRQGIHTTLEVDEYELAEKMDMCFDQGFDTIWIHA